MEQATLRRARAGDERAFQELTDPYRRELQVHCYRMLGSLTDAEDMLQETLLAAWRGLPGFQQRSSLRSWLYRIATNQCLNALRTPSRRVGPEPVPPYQPPEPTRRGEITWLQPCPDALLDGIADTAPGPGARYQASEAVELAFVASRAPSFGAAAPVRCSPPLTTHCLARPIHSSRTWYFNPALDEEVTMTENFVLVHGAWHGGWAWQPVASRLRAAGHRVWAPTCPGLGIDDDPRGVTLAGCIDSVVSQVEACFAVDVTLVGHSWGGYVIAGAAPRLASRLKTLVFWSAFVPESGRSLYDELPPNYQELFSQLAGASGDNTVALPLEVFQGSFMGDADPVAAAMVHSVLRPQPFRTFTDPPADEGYRTLDIPLHYVLSAGDVALSPGEYGWDRFAERIKTTPVSVPGSHESMFTRPVELADALMAL